MTPKTPLAQMMVKLALVIYYYDKEHHVATSAVSFVNQH